VEGWNVGNKKGHKKAGVRFAPAVAFWLSYIGKTYVGKSVLVKSP